MSVASVLGSALKRYWGSSLALGTWTDDQGVSNAVQATANKEPSIGASLTGFPFAHFGGNVVTPTPQSVLGTAIIVYFSKTFSGGGTSSATWRDTQENLGSLLETTGILAPTASSVISGGLDFSGTQLIQETTGYAVNPASRFRLMAICFRSTVGVGTAQRIWHERDITNTNEFTLTLSGTTGVLVVQPVGGTAVTGTTVVAGDGRLHTAIIVVDNTGSTTDLYLDGIHEGAQSGSTGGASFLDGSKVNCTVGNDATGISDFFTGSVGGLLYAQAGSTWTASTIFALDGALRAQFLSNSDFDGSFDSIVAPAAGSSATPAFTMVFGNLRTTQPSPDGNLKPRLICMTQPTDLFFLSIATSDNKLKLDMPTSTTAASSSNAVNDGGWHSFIGIMNHTAGTCELWVDNARQPQAGKGTTTTIDLSADDVSIGDNINDAKLKPYCGDLQSVGIAQSTSAFSFDLITALGNELALLFTPAVVPQPSVDIFADRATIESLVEDGYREDVYLYPGVIDGSNDVLAQQGIGQRPTQAAQSTNTNYQISIAESIGAPSDALTRLFIGSRSVAENVGAPTDSVSRIGAFFRSFGESIAAPSDSVARQFVNGRGIAETITAPTDAVSRAFVGSRSIAESVSAPTDVVTRAFVGSRSIAESISAPTDAVSRLRTIFRSIAESIGAPTDAVTRAFVGSRSIAESISAPTDALTRIFVGSRSIAESISAPTDSVARTTAFHRALSESIAIPTDALTRLFVGSRSVAENIGAPTDSVSRTVVFARAIAESIGAPTDAVARVFIGFRSIAESIGIPTDAVTYSKNGGSTAYSKSIAESIGAPTDAVARAFIGARSGAESITKPSDTASRAFAASRSISESIAIPTDALTRLFVGSRSIAESISAPTDAAARAQVIARAIAESITHPSDAVSRFPAFVRSISESIVLPSDALTRAFIGQRAIAENIGAPSDVVFRSPGRRRFITESIGAPFDAVTPIIVIVINLPDDLTFIMLDESSSTFATASDAFESASTDNTSDTTTTVAIDQYASMAEDAELL